MQFTYDAYHNLILLLKSNGYQIANYDNWNDTEKCVILRHDIDYDLRKSLEMAKLENKLNVKSTYFVLLTSDFYNVFSKNSIEILSEILSCGHDIGLHFDELNYPEIIGNSDEIKKKIIYESDVLSGVLNRPVTSVSMHRPSKEILNSNLHISGIVNSYSNEFFKEFKYLSDSRRNWREPAEKIIESEEYKKLHILTHAFWYNDIEKSMYDTLNEFVLSAVDKRYDALNDNFTDLKNVLERTR